MLKSMEKKRCQVVMLPTNEKSHIFKGGGSINCLLNQLVSNDAKGWRQNQHLYFTTDDEIGKGDWVLFGSSVVMIAKSLDDKVVEDGEGNSFMKYNCKKIIATTDPELNYGMTDKGKHEMKMHDDAHEPYPKKSIGWYHNVPQPSKAFIEEYCKVGGIDEVDVEYENCSSNTCSLGCDSAICRYPHTTPKVNSQNEIIIHPIKGKLYTREEVEQMLHTVVNDSHCKPERIIHPNSNKCAEFVLNWIKKNL